MERKYLRKFGDSAPSVIIEVTFRTKAGARAIESPPQYHRRAGFTMLNRNVEGVLSEFRCYRRASRSSRMPAAAKIK